MKAGRALRHRIPFPSDRYARGYIGFVAACAVTGTGLLIAGVASSDRAGDRLEYWGGFTLFWFAFWLIPSVVTAWLCFRQRKIRVEELLDQVFDGVDRIEDKLGTRPVPDTWIPRVIDGGRE